MAIDLVSAALCRGLIEATHPIRTSADRTRRFPRLYAAASLKQRGVPHERGGGVRFPRLYAAASLKPAWRRGDVHRARGVSAALCRGLIEASTCSTARRPTATVSAALCRGLIEARHTARGQSTRWPVSAALCRGLIEAICPAGRGFFRRRVSAALCRGLIEARSHRVRPDGGRGGFRGFMPRPHCSYF